MELIKNIVLKHITEYSLIYNFMKPCILSNGNKSPYYLDLSRSCLDSKICSYISILLRGLIASDLNTISQIGGMEMGAIPLSYALANEIYAETENHSPNIFIVKKYQSQQGIANAIEYLDCPHSSKLAIIVAPVITTGKSVLKAIKAVEQVGLEVMQVLAVIDREEENYSKRWYINRIAPIKSLFKIEELIKFKREGRV